MMVSDASIAWRLLCHEAHAHGIRACYAILPAAERKAAGIYISRDRLLGFLKI